MGRTGGGQTYQFEDRGIAACGDIAPEAGFGFATVEENMRKGRLCGEKRLKVVDDLATDFNAGIQAACAFAGSQYIPECDRG